MEIHEGLFSHGVLQRTAKNVSGTEVRGVCKSAGLVLIRVSKGAKKLKGLDGVVAGKAAGGTFAAKIARIPTGGPYTIELSIVEEGAAGKAGKVLERLRVTDVLVGDLWLLGGQSNMQGIGWLEHALKPEPLVRAFYMDDRWRIAKDPLHNLWEAVDSVHITRNGWPQKPKFQGVGPGLSFGKTMRKRTSVPQGLIACAHGGTSMSEWDPAKRDAGGASFYGATIRRVRKNGGRVAGMIWYQGESDADSVAGPRYTDRMEALIAAFRRDVNDPRMPFVLVQLARHIATAPGTHWNGIQEQQRRLPKRVPQISTVPAIDLDLDDGIHVGGRGMVVLGRRLAEAMDVLRRGKKAGPPPIELANVTVRSSKVLGSTEIVVKFANVKGRLVADGEPHGFALGSGSANGGVIRTRLEGNRAVVLTEVAFSEAGSHNLHYGLGRVPVCNIHDEAGRSLPVFGPVPLGRTRAATPCINYLQVSPLLPSAGKLNGLNYPANLDDLALRRRQFDGAFCDLHLEIGPRAPEDNLVYFRFSFRVDKPMRVALLTGYDGPVKVWVDGTERYHDPEGTNPARLDDARIEINAAVGSHEVLLVLGTNKGNAWGVFLQLERTDVTESQLDAGLGPQDLPVLEM